MATTEVSPEAPASDQRDDEDRSTRRLLAFLLWFLGIVAIVLLALLIWLLWPEGGNSPGQGAGYPIQVVTTIYGFGENAGELMQTPLGVAFDQSGHVWISNTGRSRVEEYTTDGDFVRMVGAEEGPGKLGAPFGLTVDPATDRLYVADYGAGLLQVYTASGEYVGHFPADDEKLKRFGEGFSPYAVHVVDGRVVVSSNDGLYFFDTEGHVVSQWVDRQDGENVRGPQFGQFNFPDSFTVDPETGTFYIADTMNRRIVAIDRDGKWLWTSGSSDAAGEITGFWQLPRSIQLGPDGNLYVVDTFRPDGEGMGAGHIVVLSKDGNLISEFGRAGMQDGSFAYPDQLASNGQDLWAIADRENQRVVIFRLLTPYPYPSQIESEKYKGMISNPFDTWSTPKSERPSEPSA